MKKKVTNLPYDNIHSIVDSSTWDNAAGEVLNPNPSNATTLLDSSAETKGTPPAPSMCFFEFDSTSPFASRQ